MKHHHEITAVLRGVASDGGPGWAARCEDCDVITFGGFPTALAAIEACEREDHEE